MLGFFLTAYHQGALFFFLMNKQTNSQNRFLLLATKYPGFMRPHIRRAQQHIMSITLSIPSFLNTLTHLIHREAWMQARQRS